MPESATMPTAARPVTLTELCAQIAEEVSTAAGPAGLTSELIPTTFRARIAGGTIVEIAASSVSMTKATGWTACLDPDGPSPKWVKRSLFWSWSAGDAARFTSPEEALASACRTS